MRIRESKKYFVLFCMLGFLSGILYANTISRDYITSIGIFHEFFLNQYVQTDLNTGEYIWYLLRVRLTPLVLLCALGCTGLKKAVVALFLLWTGFSGGMVLTSAIMKMGVKGVVLCVLAVTPQFVFYIAGYVVLIWYLYLYPDAKWNLTKTLCLIVLIALGLVLECYVNPVLMKMFLKTL